MPAGEDDSREHGAMYLSGDADPNCFVGPLDDEDQMSESEIRDYIKFNKPDLFKKLKGMPIKSSDPVSFKVRQTVNCSEQYPGRTTENTSLMTPARRDGRPLRERYIESEANTAFARMLALLRSTKTRIEQKLSNGYGLYRRRYNLRGGMPICSLKLCTGQMTENHTGEMIVLESKSVTSSNHAPNIPMQNEFFCNQCFSRVFSFDHSRQAEMNKENEKALYFDGVDSRSIDHHTIVNTANRLYLPNTLPLSTALKTVTDSKGYEDHAFNYPSNSPTARLLRARVQQDIENSLAEVAKYEKARQDELNKGEVAQDVNLLITRPYYMEPKDERYKKQGLTRSDYARDLKLRKELIDRRSEVHSLAPMPVLSPLRTIFKEDNICSCREPDDGTEILRCSAEFCPIGWFHLHCTNLKRMPTIREAFYCQYCCSSSEDSGIEPLRSAPSRHSSIDPDTYSPVRPRFAETTPEGYFSQYVTNWSAVNRAQYELEHSLERSIEYTPEENITTLDDGYLASDECESTYALDSELHGSNNPKAASSSYHSTGAELPPDPNDERCTTPKPARTPPREAAPQTPPQTPRVACTPTYISTKPWGTPVNFTTPSLARAVDVASPLSPSPTKKRKLDQIEDDMREIDLDFTDNEEASDDESDDGEGELVPFMLEQ